MNEMSAEDYRELVLHEQAGKPLKYRNKPETVDGIRFDSQAEAKRYWELSQLQKSGDITGLKVHPKWPLQVNGFPIAAYEADFMYYDWQKGTVVEDVKGVRTEAYKLKKRLMLALYDIEISEVEA